MIDLTQKSLINFSSGPSYLPDYVNKQLIKTLTDRLKNGKSILEISHRSSEFIDVYVRLKAKIANLLDIPDNYSILLMPGGARGQNAAIAMNMSTLTKKSPTYLSTGYWSEQSAIEAKKYVEIIKKDLSNYNDFDQQSSYYFYTNNETIDGVYFSNTNISHSNLVCDMTSSLFVIKENIEEFGAIFASSQKNLGLPGLTLLIIKNSILNTIKPLEITPSILNYKIQFEKESMYNTPVNITWIIAEHMLDWINSQGLETIRGTISFKSNAIYDFIDNSKLFHTTVAHAIRSKINIVFTTNNSEIDNKCIKHLEENNIIGTKGHKILGGIRISLYASNYNFNHNYLINCLKTFEKKYI